MAWYNASWDYRVKVTVDKTKLGGADQTNYPVYVDLSNLPAGFFTNVKSDGTDIVVTNSDGTTKLKRELVSITVASSIGELYFKGTCSSSANTDFYIYYGNAAGAETNDTDTWDSNYVLVCHMNDNPDSSTVQDSTGNNNDGTKVDPAQPTEATGKIGKGQQGYDASHPITFVDSASLDIAGDITLEIWHNGTHPTNDYLVFKSSSYDFIEYDNLYFRANGGTWEPSDSVVPAGWYYGAVVGENTTGTFYLQGAADGTFVYVPVIANSSDLTCLLRGNTYYADEIRVSNIARPASWITTTYNNESSPSTFYAVGDQEEQPAVGGGTATGFLTPRSKFRGA